MLCMPALNLLFYNGLLGYIIREISQIINVSTARKSVWYHIPIIGRIFAPVTPQAPNAEEFGENLWDINIYVNILLLLPALFQIHHFTLLVAFILMWNFYVYQCLGALHLKLMWHLWWSDLCWSYYAPLVFFGLLMNMLHLSLIIGTMKFQIRMDGDPKHRIQSQVFPEQQPHPGEENSGTIDNSSEN
ncbi:uncharacterized protein LOC122617544 isoform X1 [Drosophila teissieri]|uniref:uncharacterized protein LOC122617544 isoform X1 n=1 Tax=Drosophila teissieri TaxID=7243 RepID=UPI001CBA228B|nr:uncharacterized protein LOC122617544 isoform X1 [Drosophila teissieri]